MKNNVSISCRLLLFFVPFISGMQSQTGPAATADNVRAEFYKQHGDIASHQTKVDIVSPTKLSRYGHDKNLNGQDISGDYYSKNYGITKATAVALETHLASKGQQENFVKVYKAAEAQSLVSNQPLDKLIIDYINGLVSFNIQSPGARSQIRSAVAQTQQPVVPLQQPSLQQQTHGLSSQMLSRPPQKNPQAQAQQAVAMQGLQSGQQPFVSRLPQDQTQVPSQRQPQVLSGAQPGIVPGQVPFKGQPSIGQRSVVLQQPGVPTGLQRSQAQPTTNEPDKPLKGFWTRSFVSYVPGGAALEKTVDDTAEKIRKSVAGFAETALKNVPLGKEYTMLDAVNDILAFPGVRFALELTIFGPLGQKDDLKLKQFIMITLTTFYNQFKLTMTPVGALNMAVTKYLLPFKVMKAVLPAQVAQRASLQVHTLMVHSLTVFNQYLANGGDIQQAISNHATTMLVGNAGRIASTGARAVGGVASGVTSGIKRFSGGLKSFFIRGKK